MEAGMARVVLVTGVSGDLAAHHARELMAEPTVDKVVGIDVVPPRRDLGGVKFVRADIRSPVVGKVLAVEEIDTVVHLALQSSPRPGSSTSVKETNVIGTMQLLAACQRASQVRRLVLKSSAAVYGSSPRDPAMFTEDMTARRSPRGGFAKDVLEVEGYVRGLARRRPDLQVINLRLANLLSATWDSSLSRYFRLPVIPTVLGYDPRLQLLHPDDALAVLRRSVLGDETGVYNVAGPGVVMLSQALRRMGRPSLSLPGLVLGSGGQSLLRVVGAQLPPNLVPYLSYGRGLDTTKLAMTFGWSPERSTADTLDEFILSLPPSSITSDRLEAAQQRLGGAAREAPARAGGGHG
jgi:UDP-glucose 4-epimerase